MTSKAFKAFHEDIVLHTEDEFVEVGRHLSVEYRQALKRGIEALKARGSQIMARRERDGDRVINNFFASSENSRIDYQSEDHSTNVIVRQMTELLEQLISHSLQRQSGSRREGR